MIPMYIRFMGAEAYGLVGIFTIIQTWFQFLDPGITSAMVRGTANYRGGVMDALSLHKLLRAVEGVFVVIAVLGAAAVIIGADAISRQWLNVQQIVITEVYYSLILMGVIAALRWMSGLYRGAITGFEQLVWLSSFNIFIATIRFILVILIFLWIGSTPVIFFTYQLIIALIELVILIWQTYRFMPKLSQGQYVTWQVAPLLGVFRFSLTLAFTTSIWVLITQIDKFLLSKLLPLADYAYFTLVVLIASGVGQISVPISNAVLPHFTRLNAEGDEANLINLYRNTTQIIAILAIPIALFLAFFAKQVLWTWTGDDDITNKAASVLPLYALGNGIITLGAFPYYLQFAKGDLKLHLIGNALFAFLLVPALIWATWQYGMKGAGYSWLLTNVVYFLLWIPLVHRRLAKGLHLQWLLHDIAPILSASIIGVTVMKTFIEWPTSRIGNIFALVGAGTCLVVIASSGSSTIRRQLTQQVTRHTLRIRFDD